MKKNLQFLKQYLFVKANYLSMQDPSKLSPKDLRTKTLMHAAENNSVNYLDKIRAEGLKESRGALIPFLGKYVQVIGKIQSYRWYEMEGRKVLRMLVKDPYIISVYVSDPRRKEYTHKEDAFWPYIPIGDHLWIDVFKTTSKHKGDFGVLPGQVIRLNGRVETYPDDETRYHLKKTQVEEVGYVDLITELYNGLEYLRPTKWTTTRHLDLDNANYIEFVDGRARVNPNYKRDVTLTTPIRAMNLHGVDEDYYGMTAFQSAGDIITKYDLGNKVPSKAQLVLARKQFQKVKGNDHYNNYW